MGRGVVNPFPGQMTEWVDYSQGSGDSDDPNHSDVRGFTMDPNLATAVTSLARTRSDGHPAGPFADPADVHKLVLDLDHDAKLIPSSTPGHHHLFIDKAMRWDQLVRLLCVLAEVGLVEPGYVSACIDQGRTSVRLPHVKRTVPRDALEAFEDHVLREPVPLPITMPADLDDPTHATPPAWWTRQPGQLAPIQDVTGTDRSAMGHLKLIDGN